MKDQLDLFDLNDHHMTIRTKRKYTVHIDVELEDDVVCEVDEGLEDDQDNAAELYAKKVAMEKAKKLAPRKISYWLSDREYEWPVEIAVYGVVTIDVNEYKRSDISNIVGVIIDKYQKISHAKILADGFPDGYSEDYKKIFWDLEFLRRPPVCSLHNYGRVMLVDRNSFSKIYITTEKKGYNTVYIVQMKHHINGVIHDAGEPHMFNQFYIAKKFANKCRLAMGQYEITSSAMVYPEIVDSEIEQCQKSV